jgi:nicotinamide-nucleotide amidase
MPTPTRRPGSVASDDRTIRARTVADVVGVPFADLARLIGRLTDLGLTVATAESLTGGLLAALLTEVPGSSAVIRGGLIVYATDLKHLLAGVDAGLLADRGPVDPVVATALARGARLRCGSSIGVGLTGVAGPDPQEGVPVGTWFVAISGPGEYSRVRSCPGDTAAATTRGAIRAQAVRAALALLASTADAAATDS